MNNLVQEVNHELRKLIDESGADLVKPELPVVENYRVPFQHLFYNLLHNALKYGVDEEYFKIEICLKKSDNVYTFGIRDSRENIIKKYFNCSRDFRKMMTQVQVDGWLSLKICWTSWRNNTP